MQLLESKCKCGHTRYSHNHGVDFCGLCPECEEYDDQVLSQIIADLEAINHSQYHAGLSRYIDELRRINE